MSALTPAALATPVPAALSPDQLPAGIDPNTLVPLTPELGAWGMACPVCEVSGGSYPGQAEARYLAAIHDQVHHGGRPTAQLAGGPICESCHTRPATTVWSRPAAGAPFQLCTTCAPTPGDDSVGAR